MRHVIVGAIVGLCVLGLAVIGLAEGESPSQLLEKGLYTEETIGDLDAAIAIYQQVVADAKAARACAARTCAALGKVSRPGLIVRPVEP